MHASLHVHVLVVLRCIAFRFLSIRLFRFISFSIHSFMNSSIHALVHAMPFLAMPCIYPFMNFLISLPLISFFYPLPFFPIHSITVLSVSILISCLHSFYTSMNRYASFMYASG